MISPRWSALWTRLGAQRIPDPAPLLARLAEPQRHYHTLAHVRHCLAVYDRGPVVDDAVELALWLHDAIYDPQGRDNEERSAAWCVELARDAGVGGEVIDRAGRCILATRHRHEPEDAAERLTVAVDLTILGETTACFAAYDRRIRQEYAWVPGDIYRRERARVLADFLVRPVIFPHPWWERRFGHRARINLRSAIRRLAPRPPATETTP